ncbi:hypothetical protein AAC387_Pa04g2745 [Persea americana]
MRRQGLLNPRAYVNATKIPHGLHFTEPASVAPAIFLHMGAQIHNRNVLVRAKIPSIRKIVKWGSVNTNCTIQASDYEGMLDENQGESSDEDEDDELCPVECVREFKTDKEFLKILERAKETDSLVVVDFYRTSCGSCKYIEQGFTKLCRGSADQEAPVIFLKHNVIDEYDEQSEVAERLRIKAVPLFHFYKNGVLLEAFATTDKEKILAAILKNA